ncbi:hypothetical protein PFAG_04701 [Plasmodium falciparum Santa Lucia]|uniref:Uncharacterized protein n=16 Tax=Plasmodium falciparum TaxID=5833 RepID=O96231_PLAF7|nr:conserved Plasmodium protein, unknown function [Plasmodium falciparum 3D7]ETW20737.1 hypothetical protein PFFVO_00292 [Plasmodium falciparum Vietnam Oak-Knoll (FVO)]ETW28031.1 hypothetical protein PFFCH_04589 [Plasmodium falciparum FCH/4]ETW38990.1 hypothetical protein PFTANZ_00334 [Plasmodium falciparum Tanzania (2000708)]ETW45406.1 hypothetical protein PFNF135_00327 [Plasmodium falciparum NF135/5.C10]ETW57853.1 hypothetical protein PFUGPA_00303 [Plasmodium falciparum Palo Alto/Uganda]ETW|eukprot:XP_001349657.1 conserved Plasmodium protein, unknown function [Plasmodium falciparum 3D7]
MKKKNNNKLHYLDSKGKLYTSGLRSDTKEKYGEIPSSNKNHNLIEKYNELQSLLSKEEEKYDFVKNELGDLQKQKDLLKWHLCNNIKKLSMKRSDYKFKTETKSKLESKLKSLKDMNKIHKFEHDTLEELVHKMEQELETKMYIKNDIENIFNECINKKDEYLKDITQERISVFKERKKRQNQLQKLLLIMKQENNKNYNINYLKKYESNLMNEINSYKNYKDFETKIAMDLIDDHSLNDLYVT